MKRIAFLLVLVAAMASVVAFTASASRHADDEAAPIYGVTIPPGYRDWKMIAVAQLKTDKVDQLRAQLGNEIAIKAYQESFRSLTGQSLSRCIGRASRRKTTTKFWPVHSPALNLSLWDPA